MRTMIAGVFGLLVMISVGVAADEPQKPAVSVPAANEFDQFQYTRVHYRALSADHGRALISALDGGKGLKPWSFPSEVMCALPVPQVWSMTAYRPDGTKYTVGFVGNGDLLYLPEGIYLPDEKTQKCLSAELHKMDAETQKPAAAIKLPTQYKVGTVRDGGTLWSIAKMFYGNGQHWDKIYDANRDVLKDPNTIQDGMTLTIPALPGPATQPASAPSNP